MKPGCAVRALCFFLRILASRNNTRRRHSQCDGVQWSSEDPLMSNKMIRPYKSFSLLAGICLLVGTMFAQVKSSTITGTITDPSGALVPRATVAVLNESTGVRVETKTNESGDYAVPY